MQNDEQKQVAETSSVPTSMPSSFMSYNLDSSTLIIDSTPVFITLAPSVMPTFDEAEAVSVQKETKAALNSGEISTKTYVEFMTKHGFDVSTADNAAESTAAGTATLEEEDVDDDAYDDDDYHVSAVLGNDTAVEPVATADAEEVIGDTAPDATAEEVIGDTAPDATADLAADDAVANTDAADDILDAATPDDVDTSLMPAMNGTQIREMHHLATPSKLTFETADDRTDYHVRPVATMPPSIPIVLAAANPTPSPAEHVSIPSNSTSPSSITPVSISTYVEPRKFEASDEHTFKVAPLAPGAYDSLDDDATKLQVWRNGIKVQIDDIQNEVAQEDFTHAPDLAALKVKLNSTVIGEFNGPKDGEDGEDGEEGQAKRTKERQAKRTKRLLQVGASFLALVAVLLLTVLLVSHSRMQDAEDENVNDCSVVSNEFSNDPALTPGTPIEYKSSFTGAPLSPFRSKSETRVGWMEAFAVLVLFPVFLPTLDYAMDLAVTGTWFGSDNANDEIWARYSSMVLCTTLIVNLLFWFFYRDVLGVDDLMFFKRSVGMNTFVGFAVTALNLRAQAMSVMLFYRVVILARPTAKAVQKLLRSIALATLINLAVETVPQVLLQGYAAMLRYYLGVVEKELLVSVGVGLTTLAVGLVRTFCKRDGMLLQFLAFLFFGSFVFMRFTMHACVFVEFTGPGNTMNVTAYILVVGSVLTRITYVSCTARKGTSLGVMILDVFLTYFTPIGHETSRGTGCCWSGGVGSGKSAGKTKTSANNLAAGTAALANGSRVLHPDEASRARHTIVSSDGYRLIGLHVMEGMVAAAVVRCTVVAPAGQRFEGELPGAGSRHDLALLVLIVMASINVCALALLAVFCRHTRQRQAVGAQRGGNVNVNQSTAMAGLSAEYGGMASPAPAVASPPAMAPQHQKADLSSADGTYINSNWKQPLQQQHPYGQNATVGDGAVASTQSSSFL
jgi:hypothetical protein